MKITAIEAYPLRAKRDYVKATGLDKPVPATQPIKPAPERVLTAAGGRHICSYPKGVQSLLIRVQTDAGIEGIGESHAPVAPQVAKAIIEHLLAPYIIGEDPRAVDVLWEKMYSTMRLRGHSSGFMTEAMAGIDIALWDIFGKSVGLPIYQLLGGGYASRIKAYASGVPGKTRQERVDSTRRFVEELGFTAVKGSIGRNRLELEVEEMAALADALADEAHLLVDAHGAYDAVTALKLGMELQSLGVYWFEDPLMPEDHAGYKHLSDNLDMAVAAGETECNRFQFRDRLAARAVDIILPDVCRAGGISEGLKIARLADIYQTPWAAHVSMGTPIHIAAALHLAAATPNFLICECPTHQNPIGNNLLRNPVICEDGYFHIPEGPGLGIELDEEALESVILKT
jgi:L-alanine-DL-glutamate epimerase-like enolase superfamily enzyme